MTKFRLSLIAGAIALVASLSLVAGAGAAAKGKLKHKCLLALSDQSPGKLKGFEYGSQVCSAPYRAGLTIVTYNEKVSGPHVTAAGKFKSFFDTGSFHGTYHLAATLPTTGSTVTASGTFKILGGTAAFAGTRAAGKMACVTKDAGAHYACILRF